MRVTKGIFLVLCVLISRLGTVQCFTTSMCKFLFMNESAVELHPNQAQHYFEIELSDAPDLLSLLNENQTMLKNSSLLTFEMMSTRNDLLLESLAISNPLTSGMISITHFPSIDATTMLGNWQEISVTVNDTDYISPGNLGWSGITSIRFVFSTSLEGDPGTVSFRLMKACNIVPDPSLCVLRRQYAFGLNAHKCNCKTCHSCSCEAESVKSYINNDTCEFEECNSCWCAFANCLCCYKSNCMYECNCETCFDTSTVEICEEAIHYGIGQILPSVGSIAGGSEVAIFAGDGEEYASTKISCRFGEAETQGYYISPGALGCNVPPLSDASPNSQNDTETNVTVSVRLGDSNVNQFSAIGTANYTYVPCSVDGDCGEEGRCESNGVCMCSSMYVGDFCELKCPTNQGNVDPCSSFGACSIDVFNHQSMCFCAEGHTGDDCSIEDSNVPEQSSNVTSSIQCGVDIRKEASCSGHGVCDNKNNCECHVGFWGKSCQALCDDCSEQGLCRPDNGECVCFSGYSGLSCSERMCPFDCYEHGICDDEAQCYCEEDWTGQYCSVRTVPKPTTSFISVNSSSYTVMIGAVDTVSVMVMRTGSLEGNVSVTYKTIEETAVAGEDYEYTEGTLYWAPWNSTTLTIPLKLLATPLPEAGEESFVLALSNPQPPSLCALGDPSKAVIRIQGDGSGEGILAIRISFLCRKPNVSGPGNAESEVVFRGDLLRIVAKLLAIPKWRLFVASVSDYENGALVALDVLPPDDTENHSESEINANVPSQDVADALVEAIANKRSSLYETEALLALNVDPSYEPRVWATSKISNANDSVNKSSKVWSIFAIMLAAILTITFILLGVAYVKRHDLMWRYGGRLFRPVDNDLDEFGGDQTDEFEMTSGQWVEAR